MFFPERITKIKESDKVLEIGPGSLPHPRSDIFLELEGMSKEETLKQRGFAEKINLNKPVVYYDGRKFPFVDNEFDYIICSHVIEHAPIESLDLFISEMQRVAKKGYIEFPMVFYEFINFQPVHVSFVNYRNDTILLMDKNRFKSNYIHQIYRQMFYASKDDKYMYNSFSRYKEFYFGGFEWKDKINYKIVDEFEELVNEDDYEYFSNYFSRYKMVRKLTKIEKIKNFLRI